MRSLLSCIFLTRYHDHQESIRLNPIGFYPEGPRYAVAIAGTRDMFYLTTPDGSGTLLSGEMGAAVIRGLPGAVGCHFRKSNLHGFTENNIVAVELQTEERT